MPLDAEVVPAAAIQGRKKLGGFFTIELSRIRPDPDQPRQKEDSKAKQELTESILRVGVLQPITVRYIEGQDYYQIISGEQRYQACLAAELTEIPCWIKEPEEDKILLHQVVENWQRTDLKPYELADALARLRDANGWSQKELARMTGKPESEISRLLSLLTIDPQVQAQARKDNEGIFTRRHLVALTQVPSAEKQRSLAQAIKERGLTALEMERIVRQETQPAETARPGAPKTQRLRYQTSKATVIVAFRRREVTQEDILTALEEARDQVLKGKDHQAPTNAAGFLAC